MIEGFTKIQIFISCPSDLEAEKQRLARVCETLNQIMEENDCRGFFRINDYKNIVAPIGNRPQSVINNKYNNYDFYFGLLHKRFGTATGAIDPDTQTEYPSGTYEEFKIASRRQKNENGRPDIYFFFKDVKDIPADEAAREQLAKVKAFRQEIGGTNNYVNGFAETHDFSDHANKILSDFMLKFCSGKLDHLKAVSITDYDQAVSAIGDIWKLARDINIDLAEGYVARTVTSLKDLQPRTGNWIDRLWQQREEITLSQALLKHRQIILLGNAGSGKSTELARLIKDCAEASIPFVPIAKRFNTYVDQAIEDFLPQGWNQVNPAVCVIIIDGLDEVQPQHFNTAIRNIQQFAFNNPKIRFVISCRTNFYPLPEKGKGGLLDGFQVYFLDDLAQESVKEYAIKQSVNLPEKFIAAIESRGFNDLIGKPFFLQVLINAYNSDPNLQISRKDLFEIILQSKITQDETHFITSVPLGKRKQTLIKIIERVALVMESMGTNVIRFDQLEEILSEQHLQLLEYFPAFSKNKSNDALWGFEHNNIQEYLAARALASEPFEKIKPLLVTGSTKPRLKQTWLNTLSFLISLGNDELVNSLIKWFEESEPGVMVKFEAARIPADVRKKLFLEIYGTAKRRKVWIRSSIFNEQELAKFSQSEETFAFLLNELSDPNNAPITRGNALRVLRYFDLNEGGKEQLKEALLKLIETHSTEYHTLHTILYVVRDQLITDRAMLSSVIEKLGNYTSQYVRAGIYAVLADSPYLNDYVDYLIEGVTVSQKGTDEQRENTSLADESWNLQRAFKNITSPDALKKILEFFALPYDRRHVNYYERPEVLIEVVNNAIEAYYNDSSVFDAVLKLFLFHGRHSTRGAMKYIRPFFDQTGTRVRAFEELRTMAVADDQRGYERRISLLNIASKETIDYIMGLFKDNAITSEEVKGLFTDLDYYHLESEEDRQLVAYFRERIEKETSIDISRPEVPDYQARQKQRNQQSFDLLFDRVKFKEEVKRLYNEIGKAAIEFNDLWEFNRNNHAADPEDYFPRCVLDLLRERTMVHNGITLEEIIRLIEEDDFNFNMIDAAYDHLKNYHDIEVSAEQKQVIDDWCNKTMDQVPADKYTYYTNQEGSFSINTYATLTWLFLKKLNVKLTNDTLLNFTQFIDVDKRDGEENELGSLKKYISKNDLDNRVIENLHPTKAFTPAWRNNALYALEEKLSASYSDIATEIANSTRDDNDRVAVLNGYYVLTHDNTILKNILEKLTIDEVFWTSRNLWISNKQDVTVLINVMRKVMHSSYFGFFYQLKAAQELIQIGDDEAFYYFTDQVLQNKIGIDDMPHKLDVITRVTKIDYLSRLMELLLQSKQPENMEAFRSYDHMIVSALKSIAIQSESNLLAVTNAMRTFITDHPEIENIQFLHLQIEDIESNYSVQESRQYSLSEVIKQVDQIRPQ